MFLNLSVGPKTQDGGEEQLDKLFTYKEGDEATYFVSESLGDQELDIGPSGGLPLLWRRVWLPLRDMNLKKWRF